MPDAEITTEVDVTPFLEQKQASLRAHASQIAEDSWFLSMAPPDFEAAFGVESFIRTRPPFEGRIPEDREDRLL
jgi:LmbE family N-acetylglucosaminyl deacetylase